MDYTDYLYEAAVFYKNHLANKRFELSISRKAEKKTLEFLFLPQHLYHLIGLQKLSDLPFLKRPPANIYREILTKKLTYSDISKSKHLCEMTDRLFHYREMLNVLHADSLFFKSLHGYFKGISSDCVLTKSIEQESAFSFLFLKQNQNIYFPCSFFTRNEQKEYTKDGTHWKIISITEIPKK
jgi:hypothetical protein